MLYFQGKKDRVFPHVAKNCVSCGRQLSQGRCRALADGVNVRVWCVTAGWAPKERPGAWAKGPKVKKK